MRGFEPGVTRPAPATYAERWNERGRHWWMKAGHVFQMQSREREVLRLLNRCGLLPLGDRRILEVGCGTGGWLRDLVKWGARPDLVEGVDADEGPLEVARSQLPPGVRVHCANAAQLPYDDASFDLAVQSTMFSSILDPAARHAVARELMRVLRPGATLLWFDLRVDNPANARVRCIRRQEIELLFAGCSVVLRRACLAPPLVRTLARRSWLATSLLERVPLLCTHYLAAIRTPE